jgi:hypothetical protein
MSIISRFFVDELVDGLAELSETRRRACLFSLESGIEPQEAADLTWANFLSKNFQMTTLMSDVIATQVRHIRLPYVFWEFAAPRIATPLLTLQGSIEGAFSMPWGQLQQGYRDMVMIDRKADARHFNDLIAEIHQGKLG